MPPSGSTVPPPSNPQTQTPGDVQRPMDTTPIPELPSEPMPEDTTPAEPADDVENLFGPMPETTETPPATTPPAEATPPAETTPPADDDFFGPLDNTTETPPAETPPAETTPAQPATPETEADDFFGPLDDTGADTTPPAGAETTPPAGSEPAPAEQPAQEEEDADAGEDIFNFDTSHDVLREPGGFASTELRTWVDNTSKHSCRGRIVRFLDHHVRLLKDNGRTTTVPLNRLSANDLEFVYRQASAQQSEVAGQLAQSLSTMPLLAH